MHQLTTTGAKVAFASLATYPLVRACALKAGVPPQNVFLFDIDSVPGYSTYGDLLQCGVHDWTRVTDLGLLSTTYVTLFRPPTHVTHLTLAASFPSTIAAARQASPKDA